MSTEISTTTTPSRGLALQTMGDAIQFATMVSKTDFAPKDFRGKPESCLLAIQHGAELGLSPMQSLQSIAVVNGRPAVYGDAAMAICKGSPACEYVREWIEGDGEAMVAACEAKRRGYPDATVSRFSVADAKRAGLWGKTGPWSQYPRRMLQMRARGFALRDAFPDVLRGLVTAEEAQDYHEPAREPLVIRPKYAEATTISGCGGSLPSCPPTPADRTDGRQPAAGGDGGRVVLSPKTKREVTLTVAERARLAIASCPSVDKLDDARRKLDARLEEGAITPDEHKELAAMTLERAEILMAGEDSETQHFDAGEIDAEAKA